MVRQNWSPERLQEIMAWREKNGASMAAAADHFEVSRTSLYAAFQKNKDKLKPRAKAPAPIDIEIPLGNQPQQIVMVACPINKLTRVMEIICQ